MNDIEYSVSDFVSVFNQTIEYAYPSVVIFGELANFKITKNGWVYFDLKDDYSKLSFFASKYALPGPLEDGMMLKVRGYPKLHPQYGFSVTATSINPTGTGSIKRLNQLLAAKLEKEGLFSAERKRSLPYPPQRIGLITSMQSAAYADFIKILSDRWTGLYIECIDVMVQGDQAPDEIIRALEHFSSQANPPEVVVLIRGGGSPEDLAAFSNETVTRAVAASRVPTLVAIGHEVDISLAELAADKRASTPSNAAEMLVPDRKAVLENLIRLPRQLNMLIEQKIKRETSSLDETIKLFPMLIDQKLKSLNKSLDDYERLLVALSPKDILKRGYAIVRKDGKVINGRGLTKGSIVAVEMNKANFEAEVTKITNG